MAAIDAEMAPAIAAAGVALDAFMAARARLAELEGFNAWLNATKPPVNGSADAVRALRRDLERRLAEGEADG